MKKILIIEDDELINKILIEALSKAGYSATSATDALQGQQAAYNLKPDLIILDLMLPAGNGLELLRNLRASVQTQGISVVVITSYKDEGVQKEIESVGVQGYFNKPLVNEEVIQKIHSILGE